MKFSIITPTYNRHKSIKRCIDSILNQTYYDFEMLVCSDGHDPVVKNIIDEYNDIRIKYFYVDESNDFGATPRNYIIKYCTGDFVLYVDDDNIIHPTALDIIKKNIDYDIGMIIFKTYNSLINKIIPENNDIKHKNIDSLSVAIKKEISLINKWQSFYEHDLYFIKECENTINEKKLKIKFIDDILGEHLLSIENKKLYNKNSINNISHFYQNIEGWFDFESVYKKMVNYFDTNSHFVEIGVMFGKSTAYLATEIFNSGKNIKLDCIDIWDIYYENGVLGNSKTYYYDDKEFLVYDKFLENIKPVNNIINPIKGYSSNISKKYDDKSIDFVFIDSNHEYSNVLEDIRNWYPKIKENGVIAGHDIDWPDVNRAVYDFFDNDIVEIDNKSWIVYKKNFEKNKKINNLYNNNFNIELSGVQINIISFIDIENSTINIRSKYGNIIFSDKISFYNGTHYWCIPDDKTYMDGFTVEILNNNKPIFNSVLIQNKIEKTLEYVIKNSQSQAGQDIFAYYINRLDNGFFVDFGSGHPVGNNNTFLLERLGWNGLNFDISTYDIPLYEQSRKTPYICEDINKINIYNFFEKYNAPKVIDYLSIDIDESTENFLLQNFPKDYEFKTITFEHNLCIDDSLKNLSKKIFKEMGYTLLCENVALSHSTEYDVFEDWYINEKYIDLKNFKFLKSNGLHFKDIIKKIKIKNDNMKICVYTTCIDEETMMRFFMDYYSNYLGVDKFVIYDGGSVDETINIINEYPNVELILDKDEYTDHLKFIKIWNEDWKKYRDDFDWIIVCTPDEFLYHPDLRFKLLEYKEQGITIPNVEGFNMISLEVPQFIEGNYLPYLITKGNKDPIFMNKNIIFNPKELDINYDLGCHSCKPTGNVKYNDNFELKLLHFQKLSYGDLLKNSLRKKERLSKWMVENKAGYHYEYNSKMSEKEYITTYNSAIEVLPKIEHIYQNIPGWFDFQLIYSDMVNKSPNNAHFVEIGSWLGKSTSYMAVEIANSYKNIKFDAIDIWIESEEYTYNNPYFTFLKNVYPIIKYINIIQMASIECSKLYNDESLDFIFIDANHDYENVKLDILNWYPKLKVGGYIGGHDYNSFDHPGVVNAVNEFFGKDNIKIYHKDTWSWLIKKERKILNFPKKYIGDDPEELKKNKFQILENFMKIEKFLEPEIELDIDDVDDNELLIKYISQKNYKTQ